MTEVADAGRRGHPVLGILVGGASSRMDGFPKGLLPAPAAAGEAQRTLVEAIAQTFLASAPSGKVVLLGSAPAYRVLPYEQLPDDPPKSGPIGGVAPLLQHCLESDSTALMTACDLPYLTPRLFTRLLAATPDALAVAFERQGRVEPLPARFDPQRVLPILVRRLAKRMHSLKGLLEACDVSLLEASVEETQRLQDWDSPEDIRKGSPE